MLKTAKYIKENVLIEDGVNTTLQYCKEATGVDLSAKNFYKVTTPGVVLKSKTIVGKYELIEKSEFTTCGYQFKGWFLPQGSYICELNEGVKFGAKDVGYIILRSSLNRNLVSLISAVWDPNFTTKEKDSDTVNTMSVRVTVDTPNGLYIEENARVGQLLVFESEDGATQYEGQWQGGATKSHLVK